MKNIVFLIIVSLMAAYVAFGQCQFTRIGIDGQYAIDSATIQPTGSRCTPCPTDGTVSWSLDSAFNGHVWFSSSDQYPVSIQVTKGCDFVLLDTCMVLPQWSASGSNVMIEFAVYADAQIHVSGRAGQMVYVDVKGMPTPTEQLDIVLLDLNTCNAPVGIQEPIEHNTPIGSISSITRATNAKNATFQPQASIGITTMQDRAGKSSSQNRGGSIFFIVRTAPIRGRFALPTVLFVCTCIVVDLCTNPSVWED